MKSFFKKLFNDEKDEEIIKKEQEKNKIQEQKSLGPLQYLYRNHSYKKIGPQPIDFTEEKKENTSFDVLQKYQNIEQLKKQLWNGIGNQIRAESWKILFKYLPIKKEQRQNLLVQRRNDYQEYSLRYTEEQIIKDNDQVMIKILKVIKKDILRTLPESHFFKKDLVRKSLIRLLLVYASLHPSNRYCQGMNDIVTPIFVVFASGEFQMSYLEMVNNFAKVEEQITEEFLLKIEADTYHCFSNFMILLKQNFINSFEGTHKNLEQIENLLKKMDPQLYEHFNNNQIEILSFAFRWVFCLLLREFPIYLSIKLMDYYLVEDQYPSELCIYLCLALLMRFSYDLKQKEKANLILFLQNLPTEDWGEQDIELLVSESFTLRQLFKINQLKKIYLFFIKI